MRGAQFPLGTTRFLTAVRTLGQVIRYDWSNNKVDCKSEGNILGVKKWL